MSLILWNVVRLLSYSHDWLAIHDGGDDLAPLIGEKLCGDVLPDPIISSGNELLLIFHSDGTNEEIGFKIGVKAYYQSKWYQRFNEECICKSIDCLRLQIELLRTEKFGSIMQYQTLEILIEKLRCQNYAQANMTNASFMFETSYC